ncbi:MAG: transporter substrate-binding domain-containing protein, partial [Epsilonproteobacteria bacterium]|nr:transporter substrate-binding domain-containing protein [Campylobacterota bacterium]
MNLSLFQKFSLVFLLFYVHLFALDAVLFTKEEKNWISTHKNIVVGGGPDWAPFDFVNKDGIYDGIAKDYLQLISKQTGLKFKIVIDKWSNNLQKMKEGKIDLLGAVYYTKERTSFMNYTKPYFEMLDYFFIRDDLKLKTLQDLDGKIVAIPKGYAHEE